MTEISFLKSYLKDSYFESILFKGAEGNSLMHEFGLKSESLNLPHNYVPWIVVNGQHNQTLQNQALTGLTGLIC